MKSENIPPFNLTLSLAVKYGLHASHFGKLPSLSEYQHLHSLSERGDISIYAFSIAKELALLEKNPQAQLCISVPTLGFTDPALDYCLSAQFAFPISLNAMVGKNAIFICPKIMVKDIAEKDYTLLTDKLGKIDFSLMEEAICDNKDRFTTLKAITFCYNKEQLLDKQDLITIKDNPTNEIELLIPTGANTFTFQVSVVLDNKILHQVTHEYKTKLPKQNGKVLAIWQEGRTKSYLHVNYRISGKRTHCQRARVIIDIPKPEGVEYTWQSDASSANEKSLRFTQYYGLSFALFKEVIGSIVSLALFEDFLLGSAQQDKAASYFNRYDHHPKMKLVLYEELIVGVLNQSVPLFSLSPYFANFDEIKNNLLKIDTQALDAHDKVVFEKLSQFLDNDTHSIMPLIDEVDRLLSLGPHYLETTIALETTGKALNANEIQIKATLELEEQSSHVFCTLNNVATVEVLKRNRQLTIVPSQEGKAISGAVYTVNSHSLEKGADIIVGFNLTSDKINLSDLISALKDAKGGTSVVHARITPQGDTEIWIEQQIPKNEPQHFHIATLKGLNTLPKDIHHFIEVGQ